MIEIEKLKHSFGSIVAVDEISFSVGSGEILALIGPNGAGKTTILNVLSGILMPDGGRVLINGSDFIKDPRRGKAVSAYIPEQPYIWGKLTGIEFLKFVRNIYKSSMSTEGILGIMKDYGIYDYRDRLIETYSHGIRQKLIFLTIPIIDPRVILLDEPLVGLDPRAAGMVTDMVRKCASTGAAVLLSTHVLSFAEKLAHRVMIIDEGRIVLEGQMADILEKHKITLEEIFLEETAR